VALWNNLVSPAGEKQTTYVGHHFYRFRFLEPLTFIQVVLSHHHTHRLSPGQAIKCPKAWSTAFPLD
jgi:hypothetical protein